LAAFLFGDVRLRGILLDPVDASFDPSSFAASAKAVWVE
jgi:hypothetical protein